MTQLVFFWIKEFRNLKNANFNFGSKYIFEVVPESKGITSTRNIQYVDDFFLSETGERIVNVSAIVGENASGKSSMLLALDKCMSKNTNLDYAIIYFVDGEYIIDSNYIYVQIGDNIICNTQTSNNTNSIFYSSLIDLSIYPIDNLTTKSIDISSNNLLNSDFISLRGSDKTAYNMVEYHKWQDTQRQIAFVDLLKKQPSLESEINKYIKIPKMVRIYIFNCSCNDETLRVTSNVKLLFKALQEKFEKYPDDIDHPNYDAKPKEFFKIILLEQLANQVRSWFEVEGFTNFYLDQMPIATVEDIKNLRAEDAFLYILNSQKYLDKIPIIELWEEMKYIIENQAILERSNDVGMAKCHFDVTSEVALHISEYYKRYIDAVFTNNVNAHAYSKNAVSSEYKASFIHFDWSELSSGERAFFNLFSRFNHAKTLLEEKKKTNNPILILIDEGEVGFHLQWQKEYIYNLINVLPEIFSFSNGNIPSIQIIFTTHSPVSLSDIPRTNIIYLNNGEVVDIAGKSFAGNIHSIMAHSFFMRNGVMGKFAEKKINNIINTLKRKVVSAKNYESINNIIKLIDEPIIKSELEKLANNHLSERNKLLQEKAKIEEKLRLLDEND